MLAHGELGGSQMFMSLKFGFELFLPLLFCFFSVTKWLPQNKTSLVSFFLYINLQWLLYSMNTFCASHALKWATNIKIRFATDLCEYNRFAQARKVTGGGPSQNRRCWDAVLSHPCELRAIVREKCSTMKSALWRGTQVCCWYQGQADSKSQPSCSSVSGYFSLTELPDAQKMASDKGFREKAMKRHLSSTHLLLYL